MQTLVAPVAGAAVAARWRHKRAGSPPRGGKAPAALRAGEVSP
jgi:hypothetical protein